jgi:DNA-binding response OmpR family regulator
MNERVRTLIVDDEERILFVLRETLERVGHQVTTASSGEAALDHLQETPYDLVLLDLMLGGAVDGQRVLEAIRWRWPATVVVIVTAHGSLESAVEAIREGVDGYLLKPALPDEVRHAVEEAFYRRKKLLEAEDAESSAKSFEKGPFTIDLATHTATYEGRTLDLSSRELKLLAHLMLNAPEIVPAKELVSVVRDYDPEYAYEAREIIKWYIHRLRKKVEPDPSVPRHILNVRGVGYRFVE